MTVLWDAKALQEQRDAIAWLAERSPTAARSLADELDRIIRSLAAGEFEGREVSIASGATARRWPVGTMVIYYRRRGDVLEVLRVFDARREPIER